jgi:hypothetical protein
MSLVNPAPQKGPLGSTAPTGTLEWSPERVAELRDFAFACPPDFLKRQDAPTALISLLERATRADKQRDEAVAFLLSCLWERSAFYDTTESLDRVLTTALPEIAELLPDDKGGRRRFINIVTMTLHHERLIRDYRSAVIDCVSALIVSGSVAYGKFLSLRPVSPYDSGSDIDLFIVVRPDVLLKNLVPTGWQLTDKCHLDPNSPLPDTLDGARLNLATTDGTPVALNVMSRAGLERLCALKPDRGATIAWAFSEPILRETVRCLDGTVVVHPLTLNTLPGETGTAILVHDLPLLVTLSSGAALPQDRYHSIGLGGVIYSIAPFFDVRLTDEASLALINTLRGTLSDIEEQCRRHGTDLLQAHIRSARISHAVKLDRLDRSRVIYPSRRASALHGQQIPRPRA